MPGISRNGDKDTRNDTKISSITSVLVNGQPILVENDLDTRGDRMVEGSSTVFVGGKRVCRQGDRDSRNDSMKTDSTGGSTNVLAN